MISKSLLYDKILQTDLKVNQIDDNKNDLQINSTNITDVMCLILPSMAKTQAIVSSEHKITQCFECGDNLTHEKMCMARSRHYKKVIVPGIQQCDKCELVFANTCALAAHLRNHKMEPPFICFKCGNIFPDSLSFLSKKTHTCRYLNRDFDVTCPMCSEPYTGYLFIKHMQTMHCTLFYKCPICTMSTDSEDTVMKHLLRSHVNNKTDSVTILHKCLLCPDNFINENSIIDHLNGHLECYGYEFFTCQGCEQKVDIYEGEHHIKSCKLALKFGVSVMLLDVAPEKTLLLDDLSRYFRVSKACENCKYTITRVCQTKFLRGLPNMCPICNNVLSVRIERPDYDDFILPYYRGLTKTPTELELKDQSIDQNLLDKKRRKKCKPEKNKRNICNVCKKQYSTKEGLDQHYRTHGSAFIKRLQQGIQ